jgi:GTP cyclohydrolase III
MERDTLAAAYAEIAYEALNKLHETLEDGSVRKAVFDAKEELFHHLYNSTAIYDWMHFDYNDETGWATVDESGIKHPPQRLYIVESVYDALKAMRNENPVRP